MTTRLAAVTHLVDAAPGDVVVGTLRIDNDGAVPAMFTVRIVGLQPAHIGVEPHGPGSPPFQVVIGANGSSICDVPIAVPTTLGTGQHAAAFEVVSDRPGDRPVLSPFTLSIASVERVAITPTPSTIRARRRAKFDVEVVNNEPAPVEFTLDGGAPDVRVRFKHDTFRLVPGQHAHTRVKLKGPRRWAGETVQHNVQITARGRAAATSVTTPFIQRPLFAQRLRTVLAAVCVLVLALAALGGVLLWSQNRGADDDTDVVAFAIDADGDGLLDPLLDADGNPIPGTGGQPADNGSGQDVDGDGFFDPLLDADGNPIPGTGGNRVVGGAGVDIGSGEDLDGDGLYDPALDAAGNPIPGTGGAPVGSIPGGADGSDGGDQVASGPKFSVVGGTIRARGADDVSGITIRTTPIQLTASPSAQARAIGFASVSATVSAGSEPDDDSDGATKFWSARLGAARLEQTAIRQSEPLDTRTKSPDGDGIWFFSDVLVGRSHEFVFAKPGYDTQSFVLTPPADGSAMELDVELEPASGRLGGTIERPGGADLGGVNIEVSDGTLVFETTSATDTDVGTWDLDGVSTPGTYTITASLPGFGTEVVQVKLGQGEENNAVDITMTPGVGAIGGRVVDENANPLGGVALTASNGNIMRTTSSQTDGAIGSYNIPQLDINPPSQSSENYTVTAELSGYVTQTRRVPLGGSISNVNFVMVGTTQSLSGTVTSAATNGGILDAGVTLTKDDLMFRTTTNGAGSFGVNDLPPGNYVVTIEHFEHLPVTEFVTIQAGVAPPPLNVTLAVDTGDSDVGTGTLVVTVVDENAETAEDREITDATIVLTRTLPPSTQTFESDGTFTYTIADLALGTYTLVVTARGFNDSAPRQVSIGRSTEEVLIPMQKLGSARGTVVDALTGELLSSYSVTLTRILDNGEEQRQAPLPSSGTEWATAPNALETGTWSATIEDEFAPPGYTVLNNQIFDPEAGGAMRFIIPNDAIDQIVVPAIEAVPYPNITGRIFTPVLVGGATVFLPLDDDSLTVEMRCGANSYTDAVLTDELPVGGSGGLDTFFIDKRFTDGSKLIGDCELVIRTDTFDTKIVSVPNVTISDGVLNTDRVVNIGLNEPAGDFGGRVFWVDQRTGVAEREVPLVGIDVRANATVDFRSSDTGLPQDDSPPEPVISPIATITSTGGAWAFTDKIPIEDYIELNQQIFNTTTYDFDATGFGESSIAVQIDENGRTITGTTGINLDQTGGQAALAVELTPPDLRTISGEITIVTTDVVNRDYSRVGIDVTGPVDPPALTWPTVGPTATSGSYSVGDAPPGTWTTVFTAPDNHVFRAPTQVQARLEPGTDQAGFDTTLVELGLLDVQLSEIDNAGNVIGPITGGATVRLFSETSGYAAPAPVVYGPGSGLGTDGNVFRQTQLPVHDTDPLRTPVTFRVEVEVPGYDTRSARIFDAAGAPVFVNQTNEQFVRAGSRPFLAGTKDVLDIRLAKYGSITGEVFGITSPGVLQPLDIPASGEPVVTATQVLDINGLAVANPAAAQIIGPVAGQFSVSGPPGYYRIEVAHPNYLPPVAIPSGTTRAPPIVNPPVQIAGLFVMENDAVNAINGSFELPIRTSSLDITALRALSDPTSTVTNAWYFLESTTVATTSGPIGTTGQIRIDGLLPGQYTLRVRSYPVCVPSPTDDCIVTPAEQLIGQDAFPTIIDITIGESTAATPSVRRVRVPLPSLQGNIVGTVRAENQDGKPVPIPLPVTIDADFAEPDAEVDGDPVANSPLDRDTLLADPVTPSAPSYLYSFDAVPTGVHTIGVPDIAGYVTPTPATRSATVTGPGTVTGPEFVYVAKPTTVTFRLTPESPGHAYPNLTVLLTSPTGVPYDQFDVVDNVVTIGLVNPEIGTFSLFLDDDLHTQPAVPVEVPVDVEEDGTPLADFVAVGDKTRVSGLVQQNAGSGSITGLGSTGVVTFTPVDPSGTAFQVPHSAGVYEIDVDPGRYDIQAVNEGASTDTNDDYSPSARIGLQPSPLIAGTIAPQPDLVLEKLASLSVTITNADAVTNGAPILVDVNDTASQYDPAPGTAFRFDVPAGTYRVEFSGDSYPRLKVSTSDIQLAIGQTSSTGNITLPRQLRVVVTGVATATVRIRPAGGGGIITQKQQGTGEAYLFVSTPAADAPIGYTGDLPATGDIRVTVSSGGAGTVQQDIVFALGTELTVPLVQNPIVAVSGTLTFPGGVPITSIPGGTAITATAPQVGDEPAASIAGVLTTDTSGTTYLVEGLSTTSDGTLRKWTISVDEPGLGIGSDEFFIRSTSAPTLRKNFTITPEDVKVVFTVTSTGGDPVTGSRVTVAGDQSGALGAGGSTIEMLVAENTSGAALDWSVSGAADHLTANGTLSAFTSRDDVAVAVALTSTRIKGVVSDGSGPFVGATVKLCPIGSGPGNCTNAIETTTSTDGGQFSFAGQSAGIYPLFAVTTSGIQAGSSTVTVGTNGVPTSTATVVMASRTIRGVVQNAAGPVVGATVKLCPIGSPTGDCNNPVTSTTSVADGVFTLNGQTQGEYPIYAATPTVTEAGISSVVVDANGVPTGAVTVTMTSTAITGAVSDAAGPVVGATVDVCPIGTPTGPCTNPVTSTTTTAGGAFSATGQPPGIYPIHVRTSTNSHVGVSSVEIDAVGIPTGSVTVALQATAITGTVSNSSGAVVGAAVKLCPIGSTGDCVAPLATATSVAGGAFTLTGQDAGTYPIFVSADSGAQAGSSSVVVGGLGVPTGTVSVTLASTTINGTVSNAGGAVVGATVKLCPIGSPAGDCAGPLATTTSTAGGAFTFTGRTPGVYPVFATKSTTTGTPPDEVTVTESGSSSFTVDANGVPTSTVSITIV